MIKAVICALLTLTPFVFASVASAGTGGIVGRITDAHGQPLANIEFDLGSSQEVHAVRTDRNGVFADITLDPGLYQPNAGDVYNVNALCPEIPVFDGEVTHVHIVARYIGGSLLCDDASAPPSLVDPNQTSDLYRI